MTLTTLTRRHLAALLAAVAAVCALAAVKTVPARGDAFGQLSSFGSVGTGTGQFWKPTELGYDTNDTPGDTSDDALYVLDLAPDLRSYRLQKLDPGDGSVLASATIPRTADGGGNQPVLMGIVVDSSRQRLYLLQFRNGADTSNASTAAEQILVFSTQPAGSTLQAPADLPGGTLPGLPAPTTASALDDPRGFALDPTTNDLLVLAYDRGGNLVIQRVGADGRAGGRFVDSAGSPLRTGGGYRGFDGLAVNPVTGTVYVGKGALSTFTSVFSLPPSFASVSTVVGGQPAGETWQLSALQQPATGAQTASGHGGQLAVSPDGGTLYWPELLTFESQPIPGDFEPGSYLVRGFSIASGRTSVIYGGGPAPGGDPSACVLTHLGSVIAPASDGTVWALDPGDYVDPAPAYGATVAHYGPGGTGCPAPVALFTVGGSSEGRVTVQKGASIAFDATSSQLHGASPREVDWDFDGSGNFATVVTGSPASLSTTHRFLDVGTFDVGLRMALTSSPFGNPQAVVKSVTVVAGTPTAAFRASTSTPAAGGTVTFDASASVDPTGSDTAGPTNRLRTYGWDFGDGATQQTSTPTVGHAFANASTSTVRRTVRLTVTSFDGVSNPTPVSQTVTVQGIPSSGGPTDPPRTTPIVTPPPIVPGPGRATLTGARPSGTSAALTIACAASPGICSGTVTLTATLPAPRRGRRGGRARPTTVGSASFSTAAGARSVVTVKLSKAARALLASRHKLKLSVRIETRNSAGATATAAKTVTLVLPVRRKARRRH